MDPWDGRSRAPSVSTRTFAPHGAFIELAGDIDFAFVAQLRTAIAREVANGHRHIVVDLTDAALLDCASVGAIMSEIAPLRTAPDATVLFAGASGLVARLLGLLGFDRVCELVASPDAAAELALDASRPRAEGWRQLAAAAAGSRGMPDRTPMADGELA
jgi:anti-sigma B factor antagonist